MTDMEILRQYDRCKGSAISLGFTCSFVEDKFIVKGRELVCIEYFYSLDSLEGFLRGYRQAKY